MDEFTADAFANRDEPVPLLAVPGSDIDTSASDAESIASTASASRSRRLKQSVSPSRLRTKAEEKQAEKAEEGRQSLQDRLFTKLLGQVIPTDSLDDEGDNVSSVDRRSSQYVKRPAFSLPLMTNNFRRFNARIGIVFVFQNRLIRLFTWRQPSHTISLLATYTFVCLNPYLLVVVPLAIILLFVMVPAFISRHPPPPPQASTSATTPYYTTYAGPAIAPARTIKPASETSKDFFRNMRDLQNSMADFSNLHDTLVALIAPATNFSDEILSSTIFLYLTALTLVLFITSHLLPWRLILLIVGYTVILSGHPTVQAWLIKHQKTLLSPTSPFSSSSKKRSAPKIPALFNLPLPSPPTSLHPLITSLSTITISTTPETREVEIFELQHRPLSSISSSSASEWTPHLFTPTPYDPLSPARIAGDRPRGTRFFEDVLPPNGWDWHSKKWELDLEAGEWVNERLVVGVEYGVVQPPSAELEDGNRKDNASGEFGGWVWDLAPPPGSGGREEEVWLAYGDYDFGSPGAKSSAKKSKKEKREKDWEEAVRYGNLRTGEWRRRRWVRVVKRRVQDEQVGGAGA
ncbi:uncharacterized protein HMPREF1541_02615 [Cyphellophora europaea CBS 101466]|uniref:TECPR1-like DysF domain-containing protein n=1 Tax=Cyphellophora europaea (strain CBS 101466) TaxID=1220924 RepID=W2S437_CYPE1|nr:uncharacterized protein HMPREF1541_02615 [Cyphellophora europaea CBS 101466]ETN43456.1 hypothetical protein HMPREF1541_02615 [Cyphellophora europaea CBS 101466]